jgi:hypothetical protein
MAWVKANVWIVVLCAVILIVLPAGWVGSSMWNASIRTARQKEVDDNRTKLNSVKEIPYTLKSVVPGQEVAEHKGVPNEKSIAMYAALRAKQDEQVAGVLKSAQELNSRGHTPLIDGLFPQPAEGDRQAKVLEFMGALVPTKDRSNPSAYERLLASIGAGGAPDYTIVLQSVKDARARELERMKAAGTTTDTLSETEQKELQATLVNQRLAQYKAQAGQISVYATMDIFPKFSPADTWPQIPDTRLAVPPTVERCFTWQCDYWTVQDLLSAVRLANTDAGGRATKVPDSVVKRIESNKLGPPPWLSAGPSSSEESGSGAALDPQSAVLTPVYSASVTGRVGGKANPLYDVRRARVVAVVSMARLPQFFNAISRANFMTVVGVNLRPVNINNELDAGYYYGTEAVIRADIDIECVWLRNWTAPLTPDSLKEQLGIKVEKPEGSSESSSESLPKPAGRGGR